MHTLVPVSLLTLTLLVPTGCAYTVFKYSKPGAAYGEYLEDRSVCLKENMTSHTQVPCLHGGLFVTCMVGLGWHRDQANGFGPPDGAVVSICPGT